MNLPNAFEPYDDATQPAMTVAHYSETGTRVPKNQLFRRPLTLTEITGPTKLGAKLKPGDNDLSHPYPQQPRAMGQLIRVAGRLMDEDGQPVRGSIIELWHANSAGRYNFENATPGGRNDDGGIEAGRLRPDVAPTARRNAAEYSPEKDAVKSGRKP